MSLALLDLNEPAKTWLNPVVNNLTIQGSLVYKQNVLVVTGTTTLTPAQSGALIGIDSSASAVTITLPAISSSNTGIKYRIYWKVAGNNSTVASAAAAGLNGITINAATSVLTAPSNKQTFTFVSGTAHLDDYIDLIQGIQAWQFLSVTTVNGGITIA